MSKEIKFLGFTIRKGSVSLAKTSVANPRMRGKTMRSVIKPQPRASVKYQIENINTAEQLAKNPENPDRSRLLLIYEYIMKDGHLKSQIRNAKFEVLSEPWLIYQKKKPLEDLSESLLKTWMNAIIEYILEAEFYGYSLVELIDIDPANFKIGEVYNFPRDYVSIENKWILIDGTINGSFLPYAEIMNEVDLLEFGRKDDYGILLECAYNVIWKYYSRSDWSRHSEKFGAPFLAVMADTNNDDELDKIEQAAANMGTDGYIVLQEGDKVELKERTGQKSHDIYLDNIKICNEEISKAINGQGATSDAKAFVGSAEVQERVMNTFTMARLQKIHDEMNDRVLPYLRAKGFKIPEDAKFDYPALIRAREKRIKGDINSADKTDPANPEPADKPKPASK